MGALAYFCFLSVQRVSPSLPLPTTPLSPPPTTLQITLLVLLRSDSLLLILSTLATTTTFQARCTMRGLTAATGLVQQSPERMHTSWTSIAPMSSLRITTVVATVTLFAVSGGERRRVLAIAFSLYSILTSFLQIWAVAKSTTASCIHKLNTSCCTFCNKQV